MSVQSPSVGVLDIKNATLRVGKLEVASVQGIDASLNTFKANSILLFDDQRPDTTKAFTTSGSAVYNTSNISLASGAIYTGLGLPNAWVAEFEMAAPATGVLNSSVSFEFYSTDIGGGGGYKLNFNTVTDPQKIELSYDGTAIASAQVDIEQVGYRKYVVIYERGAISVSIDGTRYFYHNDIERAGPYTVGTGGFIRFACAGTDLTRDLRKFKISNDGPWNFVGSSSDIAYLNGSVGIGTVSPGYTLDVNGDINLSGNFYQGGSPFVSSEWTTSSESLYYRSNVEIGTANLFVDTKTSNVGIGTTMPGYTLDVNGDINFSGNFYQGGSPFVSSEWTTGSESLYYRSNVEIGTANLFVDTTTSNVGIGTTMPVYTLDVNGDINFSGNFYQGGSPFVSSEWTTGSESLYYRSNVEIGTANLFVDTTTGNVGIGTTTPQALLELSKNTGSATISPVELRLSSSTPNASDWDTTNAYARVAFYTNDATAEAPGVMASIGAVASSATGGENTRLAFFTAEPHLERMSIDRYGNVGIGQTEPQYKLDVHGSANVGTMTINSNVYAPNLPLATIASNLVTWNSSTGDLMDSGGLITNKLAIVSEQPPVALTGASTVVDGHGTYKVASGTGTPQNAFDKSTGVWTSTANYGSGVYVSGASRLHTSTEQGDWISLEFPYKATLRHLTIAGGNIEKANIYATNDGITWTELKNWESSETTIVVNASATYKKYGLVVTKTTGSATLVLNELRFFAESFAIDGGKVAMASAAITGGNTVVDQTGPHARASPPLRKYPEVALTSNVGVGGYVVSASSDAFNVNGFYTWKAFNEVIGNEGWHSAGDPAVVSGSPYNAISSSYVGEWLKIQLPVAIKLEYFNIAARVGYESTHAPEDYKIFASSDDSNWVELVEVTGATYTSGQFNRINVNATSYYKYYAIVVQDATSGSSSSIVVGEWELYGYEETSDPDTSVDTTITSQFNLPDTTGVKLYIDGDKGSTATDYSGQGHTLTENNTTYDSTQKAWSFSSLVTSNVTMTSGDLAMEGTHPHSVSLWFNAANVSSNATLFHVGTAAGEGDAKTSISLTKSGHLGWIDGGDNQFVTSNTWHNIVYATQGSGGVRTCYLDGRKLGDVQVQDTFGDYPPFAMTTYSQYGYTVSASNEESGSPAWNAFDNEDFSASTPWRTNPGTFNTSSRLQVGGDTFTDTNGGQHTGHWIKIKMPHKLILNWVDWFGPNSANQPYTYAILATNNETHWDLIYTESAYNFSSSTAINSSGVIPPTDHDYAIINATKAYDTFIFVVKAITGTGGKLHVGDIKMFGHKENDTTRFPISSSVQKYPHIAMTGPVQRGYVVRVSSFYSSNYDGHYALNEKLSPTNQVRSYWSSADHYTSTGAWDTTYNTDTYKTTASGTNYYGDFIEVEFPRKITLSHITIHPVTTAQDMVNRLPSDGVVAGWNGSSWDAITTYSDFSVSASTHNKLDVNASTAYSKIRLVVTALQKDVSLQYEAIAIDILRFYGTEEDIDIVARVGEGLDGKVANFRVYDKYLHEEQALELWDAQKDQFGVATSSVVVHKGRLGVGTTEPEGRFAVLDEPGDVEEFPPRAMTDFETYMEGHGVFRASADSWGGSSGGTLLYRPWKAFIKGTSESASDGNNSWLDSSGDFNSVSGVYDGSVLHHNGSVSGEYLQLELPYEIKLSSYSLAPWNYPTGGNYQYADFPRDFIIYGSKDHTNWDVVDTRSGQSSISQSDIKTYNINSLKTYKYFTIVITKINTVAYANGAIYTGIGEWRLFGTRQGQSTLHDGELKLTKNLTVPRIGPPLDADDTPRRDRLVVEYNTSTNPTENEVVRDTSGRGLDGRMYSGASYNATEKALNFTASTGSVSAAVDSSDSVKTSYDWGTTTPAHSQSVWFKRTVDLSDYEWVCGIGTADTGKQSAILISGNSLYRNRITFDCYNDWIYSDITAELNTWYHVVAVYTGASSTWNTTNCKIYVDGVLRSSTAVTSSTFNLTGNYVTLAATHDGKRGITGFISNYKLYDVALTAMEVKRLYDMGRYDEGHHVVNFSKTRVGIGLGDGQAPRADLDVCGIIHANGGQSWPIPTAVFSNVTPSNTGSAYYERNIGTQWVYYNTVQYADSSGTILSPPQNSRDITLTRTGVYEIYTSSSLKLQSNAAASHIGIFIRAISGSAQVFENDGYHYKDTYNQPLYVHRLHRILVTSAPTTVGYYMQPVANYTDRFRELAYGPNYPLHTVMIKYLG